MALPQPEAVLRSVGNVVARRSMNLNDNDIVCRCV